MVANDADIEKLVHRLASMRELAARAVQNNPNDERALFGAAMALRISGDYQGALRQFDNLKRLQPDNTHYLFERGLTQEYLGQFDEAIASYEAALHAESLNYRARHALVQLQKQSVEANHISELERQIALPDNDGWRWLHLGHALAKTYEDLGEPEKSFEWLAKAKETRKRQFPYQAIAEQELASAAASAPLPQGAGCEAHDPIFVTGLARSGTTLVDRILSSHPWVMSAGEIGNFVQLLKLCSGSSTPPTLDVDMLSKVENVDLYRLGRCYVDSTRPLTGSTPRFIDKAPSNFYLAPIILRALPNARIICMRRHPLDSVLSNYKQIFPFNDRYYDYAYDLTWAAEKFVIFDRLIAHWRDVLSPDRFMVLQYEDLVASQEERTRRLLAFCGLSWHEQTLAFHQSTDGVATPSARQVRHAMNSSAVGRWAKYGALLDPARRVLERAGISVE